MGELMQLDFDLIPLGMQTPSGEYPGKFAPNIARLIKRYIEGYSNVLHLFSGDSTIGKVRVDLEHPKATWRGNVTDFLIQDKAWWEYTILDPPYHMSRKAKKLLGYGSFKGFHGNVAMQRCVEAWAPHHTWRIIWLDFCAPCCQALNAKRFIRSFLEDI